MRAGVLVMVALVCALAAVAGETNAPAVKAAKLPKTLTIRSGRVFEQVLLVERSGTVLRIKHVRGGSPQSTLISRAEVVAAEVPVWFPTNEAGKVVDYRASAEDQAKWSKAVRR